MQFAVYNYVPINIIIVSTIAPKSNKTAQIETNIEVILSSFRPLFCMRRLNNQTLSLIAVE